MTRRGDWMQTRSGRAFWPLDPRPEDIDPDDIAHALGMLCRYGGHVERFYSVAEHCVLVSEAVAPEYALHGLLHDATEAYLVDLPRPIKRQLPDYAAAEALLWLAVAERFGVDPVLPAAVKAADNRILLDERAELMPGPPPLPWRQDEQSLEPLGVQVRGLEPKAAAFGWRERLRHLTGAGHASAPLAG